MTECWVTSAIGVGLSQVVALVIVPLSKCASPAFSVPSQ